MLTRYFVRLLIPLFLYMLQVRICMLLSQTLCEGDVYKRQAFIRSEDGALLQIAFIGIRFVWNLLSIFHAMELSLE